ncbi:unnamed protein product [Ixodes persulcatus]
MWLGCPFLAMFLGAHYADVVSFYKRVYFFVTMTKKLKVCIVCAPLNKNVGAVVCATIVWACCICRAEFLPACLGAEPDMCDLGTIFFFNVLKYLQNIPMIECHSFLCA